MPEYITYEQTAGGITLNWFPTSPYEDSYAEMQLNDVFGGGQAGTDITASAITNLTVTSKAKRDVDNTTISTYNQVPIMFQGTNPVLALSAVTIGSCVAAHLDAKNLNTEALATYTGPTTVNMDGEDHQTATEPLDVAVEQISTNVFRYRGKILGINKQQEEIELGTLTFLSNNDIIPQSNISTAIKTQSEGVTLYANETASYDITGTSSNAVLATPIQSGIIGAISAIFSGNHNGFRQASKSVNVIKGSVSTFNL